VSMDRECRAPYELSGCTLCPVLLAATCLSVCLSTCHKPSTAAQVYRQILYWEPFDTSQIRLEMGNTTAVAEMCQF
jgi:hypothetical protein